MRRCPDCQGRLVRDRENQVRWCYRHDPPRQFMESLTGAWYDRTYAEYVDQKVHGDLDMV